MDDFYLLKFKTRAEIRNNGEKLSAIRSVFDAFVRNIKNVMWHGYYGWNSASIWGCKCSKFTCKKQSHYAVTCITFNEKKKKTLN